MKYITKTINARTFTVRAYNKDTKLVVELPVTDESNLSGRALEKLFALKAKEIYGESVVVVDAEEVSAVSGLRKCTFADFVKNSDAVEKAVPGNVNRSCAVTDYVLRFYDKSTKTVTEEPYTDYEALTQKEMESMVKSLLSAANDSRILVDMEEVNGSESMRTMSIETFIQISEPVPERELGEDISYK